MDKLINVNSYPINKVLKYLLTDKTTGKNIIWATDTYTTSGKYKDTDTIETVDLVGFDSLVLQPRISKSLEEQQQRTRKKAEVFTPVWLCNHMNNYCDEQWFGRKDVFNIELEDHSWKVVKDKIEFPKGKSWKKYVDSRRLEITCGEAPFLVSRYDMATGDLIHQKMRIGILDRKMRIVNENASDDEWLKWAIRAFQSSYGFEYQGDNLLIARINMLLSFRDYYLDHFIEEPDIKIIKKIATIISWNIWQMDGLHNVVPKGSMNEANHQFNIFEMFLSDNEPEHKEDVSCKIYNWRSNESLFYKDCKGDKAMSKKLFDFCAGNPPYQESIEGENETYSAPVYDKFMDAAYSVAEKVELIHPARFLFNAGSTPKAWNEKMLNDEHFKILEYEEDCTKIFSNTDIKGGIVISYRDDKKVFDAIKVFTKSKELSSILNKVSREMKEMSLMNLVFIQNRFDLDKLYEDHPEFKSNIGSNGKDSRLEKNIFAKIPIFTENPGDDDVKVLGIHNLKRTWRYIPKKYIDTNHDNLDKYKVVITVANGNGAFGQVLSNMEIENPGEAYTRSFIGIGKCDTRECADNILKYLKTKFCRTMLSVLKVTQMNNKDVWKYVPIQDFTDNSDILWSKSIHEIDLQMYEKYGLNDAEIKFIETNVKEMS